MPSQPNHNGTERTINGSGVCKLTHQPPGPSIRRCFQVMTVLIVGEHAQRDVHRYRTSLPKMCGVLGETQGASAEETAPPPTRVGPESEALFFLVRLSVAFMPRSMGNGIIQGGSSLPLASHSLHAVHLPPRKSRWNQFLLSCKPTSQLPRCLLNVPFPQWQGLLN